MTVLTDRSYYLTMQQTVVHVRRETVIDAEILWDLEDDPDGNVQHIAEHDLTVAEVEAVLRDPRSRSGRSRRSGRPQVFGETPTGRYITVIFEEIPGDPRMIYPITAYDVPPPQGKQR